MSGHTPIASNDSGNSLVELGSLKALSSFVTSICEAGDEIEWQVLMEWFECAVIGLESAALECKTSFRFDWDDVLVDGFGTARIKLSASHSDSSPPHSTQSYSDSIVSLSRLFLDSIRRLCCSNCLPTRIEHHFRENVISSVLGHFINYLISSGHVVPACASSKLEEIIGELSKLVIQKFQMIPACSTL
ncbi:hypothetical protein BLNAU_19044 [Blattamonas nauphoetae]|uniref:Uncharacterized protein n=1 Tax=Blattamonas nauphoetae TaxID=2049346 RepID=A0ABQ9X359_9EUKA|nr:hypothetical protein BLNAU_19044 [Blattamonas nauphoetae]